MLSHNSRRHRRATPENNHLLKESSIPQPSTSVTPYPTQTRHIPSLHPKTKPSPQAPLQHALDNHHMKRHDECDIHLTMRTHSNGSASAWCGVQVELSPPLRHGKARLRALWIDLEMGTAMVRREDDSRITTSVIRALKRRSSAARHAPADSALALPSAFLFFLAPSGVRSPGPPRPPPSSSARCDRSPGSKSPPPSFVVVPRRDTLIRHGEKIYNFQNKNMDFS